MSPDGGLVASSTGGGLVRLFDPAKGELIDSPPWPFERDLRHRLLPGWTTLDFRVGRAGGHQALGCRLAAGTAGTADLGRHRLSSERGEMECRWGRDPRRPSVAGLARAVLGGNRCGGGEGENGEQALEKELIP